MNARIIWPIAAISLLGVPALLSPAVTKLVNFDRQHGATINQALAGKDKPIAQPQRPTAASQPQLSEYRAQR